MEKRVRPRGQVPGETQERDIKKEIGAESYMREETKEPGDEKSYLGRVVTGVFGWRLQSWVKDSPHTPFILVSSGCYNEVM